MMDRRMRNIGNRFLFTLVTVVLAASPGIASAAAGGLYVGGSYGSFKGQSGEFNDDKSNGWRAFFGGTASQIIGWEVGYSDVNKLNGSTLGNIELTSWDATLRAGIPIGPITPFGAVGATWVDVKTADRGSDSDWRYKYGLGLDFNIGKSFAVRFEVDRMKVETSMLNTDVDTAMIGALFRF